MGADGRNRHTPAPAHVESDDAAQTLESAVYPDPFLILALADSLQPPAWWRQG